jgi:hypothetical protein
MVNPIQCNCEKTTKGLITMFEEIITSNEVKFNELEKKVFKFVCFFGCLIIKLMLEAYDRKLMDTRDKKKYRHKGLRETSVNTVMGEIKYKRVMYEVKEEGITKTVYLLDEKLNISIEGKVSSNLAEKVIEVVPITDSYRKAETAINETTNTSLSHEKIRSMVIKLGDEITKKEKEERKLLDKNQLIGGLRKTTALFEEADGLWINLQGKDRKEGLEKNKKKAEKEKKEFNSKMKIKTELKLHVMYEGWKKDDSRHSLVNKQYIAGIMKPKEISKLRDARVFTQYDESKIKLRVTNGDGAKWTKGTTAKGGIYQKDQFHIMQEIVRDVPKEYRNIIIELINKKEYKKIPQAIEGLKRELGGEVKAVKKLNKLQSYLSNDLERYQDLVEVPKAPEGIEYRNMGTQESQIFSMLKNRFCSGRKAFGKHGANGLAKICVLHEKFKIDELEEPIPIDTSVEDWIKEIEENVRKNKTRADSFIATEHHQEGIAAHISHIENSFINEILKYKEINEIKAIY